MADLSSDILEAQFGPTEVAVLSQDDGRRVISTLAGGQALEFSLVTFSGDHPAAFPGIRRDMSAGMSMGKAFRSRGVAFRRRTQAVHAYELPESFRRRFAAGGTATVVEVSILAGDGASPFADILEVYSPAVEWPRTGPAPLKSLESRLEAFDRLLTELGH